jgi:hypothetical protein
MIAAIACWSFLLFEPSKPIYNAAADLVLLG